MTKANALLIAVLVLTIASAAAIFRAEPEGRFSMEAPAPDIAADGRSTVVLRATPQGRRLAAESVTAVIAEGEKRASIESTRVDAGKLEVRIRPGVLPGKVIVQLRADGFAPSRVEFNTSLRPADSWSDGTPDFMRLNAGDEHAFRSWFTYLAESQYYRPAARLAREIDDCAALIRFAFRETFRAHDARWANDLDLDEALSFPSVRKYQYPYTPLGAALFRIREGAFRKEDLHDGAFAEFADADTLRRLNTHFVSTDADSAKPGDLFFYRQLEQDLPFHAMIFVGPSHFEPDAAPLVVYHTGPIGDADGEIRRPTLDSLRRHPEPKWRPVTANTSFLGVYRWNILR